MERWARGHCGETQPREEGGCGSGRLGKGAWHAVSAARCVSKCASCPECRVVSFNPTDNDCSWYHVCALHALSQSPHTWHHTLLVRNATGQTVSMPPSFPQMPEWMPEDGTQGYTPYFYSMDVPVRVRRSISYGRGWQLLRSRGAGSQAAGPCDPAQSASSCNCSSAAPEAGLQHSEEIMPRCLPSSLCDPSRPVVQSTGSGRTILLVLDVRKEDLRFPFGKDTAAVYAVQVRYIVRLCLSLRAVNNTLPIHLLPSGMRIPAVERRLERLGVQVLPEEVAPPHQAPAWASKWARGSFSKLRALALTRFERIVLLDVDTLVLRNIDHVAAVGAPAFVFGWKCFPRRELRASLIVLSPREDPSAWRRARLLMDNETTGIYDDLGEQSAWRRLFLVVRELPAGYGALRTSSFTTADWSNVHVLHDPHLLHGFHRMGYEKAGVEIKLRSLESDTDDEMQRSFNELLGGVVNHHSLAFRHYGNRRLPHRKSNRRRFKKPVRSRAPVVA